MEPGGLHIDFGGHRALTISIESARARDIELHPYWNTVSVDWTEPPAMLELELWIGDCMPENGSKKPYEGRAGMEVRNRALEAVPTAAATLAWANPDAEYPGAVGFRSICSAPTAHNRSTGYTRVADDEIGERLYEAWRIANQVGKGEPAEYPDRRTLLSGMRGKTGLAWADNQWQVARGAPAAQACSSPGACPSPPWPATPERRWGPE